MRWNALPPSKLVILFRHTMRRGSSRDAPGVLDHVILRAIKAASLALVRSLAPGHLCCHPVGRSGREPPERSLAEVNVIAHVPNSTSPIPFARSLRVRLTWFCDPDSVPRAGGLTLGNPALPVGTVLHRALEPFVLFSPI